MPEQEAQDLTLLLRHWSEGSDEALERLSNFDHRKAQIVEMRYFK